MPTTKHWTTEPDGEYSVKVRTMPCLDSLCAIAFLLTRPHCLAQPPSLLPPSMKSSREWLKSLPANLLLGGEGGREGGREREGGMEGGGGGREGEREGGGERGREGEGERKRNLLLSEWSGMASG